MMYRDCKEDDMRRQGGQVSAGRSPRFGVFAAVMVAGLLTSGCYYDVEDDENPSPEVTATPPVDHDRDGYPASVDCDDYDASVSPGAVESCNGKDDDCDGVEDNGFALNVYYWDIDGDGYGALEAGEWCKAFDPDAVLEGGDCDDDDPSVYPGAEEVCNGVDDDCNGAVDDGLPSEDYYFDGDGDGWGTGDPRQQCGDVDPDYTNQAGDCDDSDPDVYPGAVEACNAVDDDCDGETDEAQDLTYVTLYADGDGDGYGTDTDTIETCLDHVDGYAPASGDCDDTDPSVHPDAVDTCDGVDTDCDGVVDGDPEFVFYPDADGDGFGSQTEAVAACSQPGGTVETGGDCDDTDASVYPGAVDVADNGVDDNCDGFVDLTVTAYVTEDGSNPSHDVSIPVFASIQAAIDEASPGDVIAVGPGTYAEHIDFKGKDVQVLSIEGPEVTVIDGQGEETDAGRDSVVLFVSGETNAARIEGFTITGGVGTIPSICGYELGVGTRYGGGICTRNASPTIEGNILEGNEVWGSGGAMYLDLGTPVVRDNIVRDNVAGYDGAGINLSDAGGEVVGNLIVQNHAGRDGAGLYAFQSSPLIANNVIAFNISEDTEEQVVLVGDGAGMALYDSYPNVTNNIIAYNEARDGTGGGVWVANVLAGGQFTNNTVVGNTALESGGGFVMFTGEMSFQNNILAFNVAPNGPSLVVYTTADLAGLTADHNLYYTETGGAGLVGITAGDTDLVDDPRFVDDPTDDDPLDDDYRLQDDSPARDAGNPDEQFQDPDGSTADLGAFGGPRADDFSWFAMADITAWLD